MTSEEAKLILKDRKFQTIFLDAAHDYESIKKDIELWQPHATVILSGHDYCAPWPGTVAAVDSAFRKPD